MAADQQRVATSEVNGKFRDKSRLIKIEGNRGGGYRHRHFQKLRVWCRVRKWQPSSRPEIFLRCLSTLKRINALGANVDSKTNARDQE